MPNITQTQTPLEEFFTSISQGIKSAALHLRISTHWKQLQLMQGIEFSDTIPPEVCIAIHLKPLNPFPLTKSEKRHFDVEAEAYLLKQHLSNLTLDKCFKKSPTEAPKLNIAPPPTPLEKFFISASQGIKSAALHLQTLTYLEQLQLMQDIRSSNTTPPEVCAAIHAKPLDTFPPIPKLDQRYLDIQAKAHLLKGLTLNKCFEKSPTEAPKDYNDLAMQSEAALHQPDQYETVY